MITPEYEIDTTYETRQETIDKLSSLGKIVEKWPGGSFNFQPYDTACEEKLVGICDQLGIEYKLI